MKDKNPYLCPFTGPSCLFFLKPHACPCFHVMRRVKNITSYTAFLCFINKSKIFAFGDPAGNNKLTLNSDALCDLILFAQFEKRVKHPWIIIAFSKVAG